MKTWTTFGTLTAVIDEPTIPYLFIENELGESRKISRNKYRAQLAMLQTKLPRLMGKSVDIETTQVTATWATDEWFSDVRMSIASTPTSTPKEEKEEVKVADIEAIVSNLFESKEKARAQKAYEDSRIAAAQAKVERANTQRQRTLRKVSSNIAKGSNLPIVDKSLSFKLSGSDIGSEGTGNHPQRALARRYGLIHDRYRVEIHVKENMRGNTYKGYMPEYNEEVVFCVIPGDSSFNITTFLPIDGSFSLEDDIELKNDTSKTLQNLAQMFREEQ